MKVICAGLLAFFAMAQIARADDIHLDCWLENNHGAEPHGVTVDVAGDVIYYSEQGKTFKYTNSKEKSEATSVEDFVIVSPTDIKFGRYSQIFFGTHKGENDYSETNISRLDGKYTYGYGDSPTTVKINWTGACKKVERKTAF